MKGYTYTGGTSTEVETLYVLVTDTFSRSRERDSGIRVVNDPVIIRQLMVTLHRGSTSMMYRVSDTLPEGSK